MNASFLPFLWNGSIPLWLPMSRFHQRWLPLHPPSLSSTAKLPWVPVPVFSMQPYLGRALSLMTASPWRLSWSSAAKKWWNESGVLPPSSTWGRKDCRESPWAVTGNCTAVRNTELQSAAWGDLLAPISLLWGGRSSTDEMRNVHAAEARQSLSTSQSDTQAQWLECLSPFKAGLPSMMDLVIKQLWPTPITHIAQLHTGRCLPPISTFKSPQLENDHPVLPQTLWGRLSYTWSHVEKSPVYSFTGRIYRCADRKGSTYLKTSAYLNVNEDNKSVEVKAVARTNFRLWGPCFACSPASPVWCVLLATWVLPWLWEWEKSKWLPHGVEMGKWVIRII